LLAKFDQTGTPAWFRTIGGAQDDFGYGICPATGGGFVVVAGSQSLGLGSTDVLVAKMDASGGLVWGKVIGGAQSDEGWMVRPAADGGYFVSGRTQSFGAGGWDGLVLKLDSAGGLVWARTVGGTSTDQFHWAEPTTDGGCIAAGRPTVWPSPPRKISS